MALRSSGGRTRKNALPAVAAGLGLFSGTVTSSLFFAAGRGDDALLLLLGSAAIMSCEHGGVG
jgi:hypothetical protein